jgi:hypothetical protein
LVKFDDSALRAASLKSPCGRVRRSARSARRFLDRAQR